MLAVQVLSALLLLAPLLLLARYGIAWMERVLFARGLVRENYERRLVPTGAGLFIYIGMAACAAVADVLGAYSGTDARWENGATAPVFTLAAGIVFAAGWIDDAVGERHIKGFRGHVGHLLRYGTVSTGLLKMAAVGGAAAGLTLVADMSGASDAGGVAWPLMLLRWLVICMSANALNLLDLRPGRAIKAYTLGVAALCLAAPGIVVALYSLPALAAALLLLPRELQCRCMLGDSGANVLGFALGYAAAVALPAWALALAALALAALHWTAERRSLSELIERNRLLRAVDRLGRG